MTDFYYQIKAKEIQSDYSYSSWIWPPVLSGKVTADNKKVARFMVEENYGQKLPMRVLKKDIDSHEFLLNMREIKDQDTRTKRLFEFLECKQCDCQFRIIDKYNDHNESDKGTDFCCESCRNKYRDENRLDGEFGRPDSGTQGPVIYRIKNKVTGMSYIGKTTQVFTLRWYQHFFQGTGCKFHDAIKKSRFEDWVLSIVESVITPEGISEEKFVSEREAFWINKLDCIVNGYNTATVK